jgi:electron transfer flavoprotein beta subunit
MNIIVCIKQVPATTEVKIDPKTNTLVREGVEGIINPFDTYALEEGLRLREKVGGKVTAVSMGPPQAAESLKEAIALGVDEAFLLSDRAFAGADTLATSYALVCALTKIKEFDLIICGKQTMDGDTGQVGASIAERIGLPFTAYVSKILEVEPTRLRVQRLIEEGYEVVEMRLPGVISVVKEINEPRLPSLRGMMKAKKAEISVWTSKDIDAHPDKVGLSGSPTQVVKIFTPTRAKKSEMIAGEAEEQAAVLVDKLRSQRII